MILYIIKTSLLPHMLDRPYSILNGCRCTLHDRCDSIPNTCTCFRFVMVDSTKDIYINTMIHLLFIGRAFIIECEQRVDDLLWNSSIFLDFMYPLVDFVLGFLFLCIFQITVLSSSSISFYNSSRSFFFPSIWLSSFLFSSLML